MKRKQKPSAMADDDDNTDEVSGSEESFSGQSDTDDSREDDLNNDQIETNNGEESEEPPEKKHKISKKDLYRPPTNEELNQLKETQYLFHSSLFRLQVSELLKEVQVKAKRQRQIEEAVTTLTQTIKSLKKSVEHELQSQKWLKNIQVPIHQNPRGVKGRFQFIPPTEILTTGSYVTGTCIKPNVTVDLVLVIPKESFQEKDFMNHRYLRKRAIYLAVVAKRLREIHGLQDLKYTYHNGNSLKPSLVINYQGDEGKPVCVNISAVPEDGVFKFNRFHITKNNVRYHWFTEGESRDAESGETFATPFYNNTVLQDLTMTENTSFLEKTLGTSQSIKDGVTLLKVWLRQRELSIGSGGFSGFIISMFVAYLISRHKVNQLMSSYQVMRNVLLHLTQTDWTKEPLTICSTFDPNDQPDPCLFYEHFSVVFVDVTGYVNLCSDVSRGLYDRVKQEAGLAIKFLENHSLDSFTALFMTPVDFLRKFDITFHIQNISKKEVEKLQKEDKYVDYGGNFVLALKPDIHSLLCQGLGKRVSVVQYRQFQVPQWDITCNPPSYESADPVMVGLQLNPECAFSVLDKGPPADSAEAKDFRSFWGERSELRRFKDGSVCEAVPWTKRAVLSEKRTVCCRIVQHVLERHTGLKSESVKCFVNQLDPMLQYNINNNSGDGDVYGTGEEQHNDVIQKYDELCKLLRNLKDLPLSINSIQGSAPVFRYTEVFPPLPAVCDKANKMEKNKRDLPENYGKHCPDFVMSLKVVCLLEGSGKWPEEKKPFNRLMAAFHIQLAESLKAHYGLAVSVYPRHIDVVKDNYVFRIVLGYTREIALSKMIKTPEGMVKYKDNEEALALEREIQSLPRLTSTLHGVQQLHASFSSTVRLAKRWLCSQLLTDFVSDEAIEIITAHLYLHPAPYTPPSTPIAGFQRFLYLVGYHDWKASPLLVNLNDEFTDEDLKEIPSRFHKERSSRPLMFLSTPYDKHNSYWTRKSPSTPILQRLVLLARESLSVLNKLVQEGGDDSNFKQLFRPFLDMYDIIIHLTWKQSPRQHEALQPENSHLPSNLRKYVHKTTVTGDKLEHFPVYDYDPPRLYWKELKEMYGDFALFFYDKYGGKYIAVLWKPTAFTPKDFKVSHLAGRRVETTRSGAREITVVPNKEAIIDDFRILGRGLVSNIHLNNGSS
ncbi:nucleolar protein 6-like isoform X1 [Saccostrea echinata]|uniref:nucleolar protein 6-like isoform X1 n=1 Tax=Saccostrea echinata TaxID=191078 RepID=UPI002A823F0E|nr:nucleolar protein 6-like isoform X1 [Saccostrea echinata]